MCPSLLCHNTVLEFTAAICSAYSTTTTVLEHSFFFETIKVERTIEPLQRYKVPTFTHFATTRELFETFQFLSLKVITQPSSPSCPIEIKFLLILGTCLTSCSSQ